MKYKLLHVLDLAGLNVFAPLVRLCYWEDPRTQLRSLGTQIGVPVLTFMAFLAVWSYLAPRHRTKSGQVPGPRQVVDAYENIRRFHMREYTKLADFQRSGKERLQTLKSVEERIAEIEKYTDRAQQQVLVLEEKKQATLDARLRPYQLAIEKKQQEFRKQAEERKQALESAALELAPGNTAAYSAYLKNVANHHDASRHEAKRIGRMKTEVEAMRGIDTPELLAARNLKNQLEDELQYLRKRLTFLNEANRSLKVAESQEVLTSQGQEFYAATGPQLLNLGTDILEANERLRTIADSQYAKPPTFFDQIWTSLQCVFVGFLMSTVIAIPIGVLCGLSPVFMAAVTPLVSLFKPVSPIVWLPIIFIIVGGFIETPEEAWITPAFLSSAITVAVCSLWPTLVNTALGVASIDQDHLNVARVLRLGWWTRLVKIVIPSALPMIFAGLRISLGVGWMVLIAAELLSSSPGLGKYVWDMFNNGSSQTFSQMFVVVFVVGIVGLLLDRGMIVFQRLVSFDGAPTSL